MFPGDWRQGAAAAQLGHDDEVHGTQTRPRPQNLQPHISDQGAQTHDVVMCWSRQLLGKHNYQKCWEDDRFLIICAFILLLLLELNNKKYCVVVFHYWKSTSCHFKKKKMIVTQNGTSVWVKMPIKSLFFVLVCFNYV